MTELTRTVIDGDHTRNWVVRGPEGAIALHAVKLNGAEVYVGLGAHRRSADPDVPACNVLDGQPCEIWALDYGRGRDLFEFRDDAGVLFGALTLEYRRIWRAAVPPGRCGESVPQAYPEIPPNAGSAS